MRLGHPMALMPRHRRRLSRRKTRAVARLPSKLLYCKNSKCKTNNVIVNKLQCSADATVMGNQFKNLAIIACLKTLLFTFNILFWLSGLVLLVLGIWAECDLYTYIELSPEFLGSAPHLCIGIACLILFVSSFAFNCIIKGQPVLLYIYGGFLACIYMMDCGVGASVACYRDTFAKGLYDGMTQTIMTYDTNKDKFNFAQYTLQCCGVSNYTDWIRLSPQRVIPTSCCLDPNNCITANYQDVYQRGCYAVIAQCLDANMKILMGLAIGAAALPLIGTILSCSLANYIKRSKYDVMN